MTTTIQQPPRLTGNAETDLASMNAYLGELFRAFVVDGLLAGSAPTVSASSLPDPASTTLATAQQTANDAYTAALAAQTSAARVVEFGEVTISNTDTTAEYTFAAAFEDTDYRVFVSPQTFTGSPAIEAFTKETETKATDKVTIQVDTAPGASASVTFNVLIMKAA